ncbi:MAG TPA: hypothetical protein VK709_11365 [Candidatus Saccharimonadales bacterium]|jgi:hypothetical protein|nr:hypothetical protein [Candidatus Saccharimonadales bacterium]
MIAIFSYPQKKSFCLPLVSLILAFFAGFVILSDNFYLQSVQAQNNGGTVVEFNRLAEELSSTRLGGGNESKAQLGKALVYLDSIAISALNSSPSPDLDPTNRLLAGLVSQASPVGENYRLLKIGGSPAVYAMVINFGLSGPAAVRIYAGGAGHYSMAAQIDHYAQKDFLDSDIELVPVSAADLVFVTVSGRTDDLSTGAFTAWQFNGQAVTELWNSDLLQQSSYEVEGNGFRIAYCSQVDDDRPSVCLKMSRDLFRLDAGQWKRVETSELPSPKPTAK